MRDRSRRPRVPAPPLKALSNRGREIHVACGKFCEEVGDRTFKSLLGQRLLGLEPKRSICTKPLGSYGLSLPAEKCKDLAGQIFFIREFDTISTAKLHRTTSTENLRNLRRLRPGHAAIAALFGSRQRFRTTRNRGREVLAVAAPLLCTQRFSARSCACNVPPAL